MKCEKEHITVSYKGVDITDEIGLCVCRECTKSIRKRIDDQIDNPPAPTDVDKKPSSLPCNDTVCRNPHELVYRGCGFCRYAADRKMP